MSVVIGGHEIVTGGWAEAEVQVRDGGGQDYYDDRTYVSVDDVIASLRGNTALGGGADPAETDLLANLQAERHNCGCAQWWDSHDTLVIAGGENYDTPSGLMSVLETLGVRECPAVAAAREKYEAARALLEDEDYVSTGDFCALRALEAKCLPCVQALEKYWTEVLRIAASRITTAAAADIAESPAPGS